MSLNWLIPSLSYSMFHRYSRSLQIWKLSAYKLFFSSQWLLVIGIIWGRLFSRTYHSGFLSTWEHLSDWSVLEKRSCEYVVDVLYQGQIACYSLHFVLLGLMSASRLCWTVGLFQYVCININLPIPADRYIFVLMAWESVHQTAYLWTSTPGADSMFLSSVLLLQTKLFSQWNCKIH